MQSPGPSVKSGSNSFDVYWNTTKLGTIARNGRVVLAPSWETTSYTVTGTGSDRISFRENDRDDSGALIDDVRLVAS
jgi:hypothetical protein